MASSTYDGDFWGLEGTPQWWWKYVMPSQEGFFSQLLAQLAIRSEPEPWSWLQHASGEVLQGLAMFHAAVRMGDRDGAKRLKEQAFAKLTCAVHALGSEVGFVGIDQDGPIGPQNRLDGNISAS